MLKSLCHQIAYVTDNYRHRIPDDYSSVKKHFVSTIQKGEFHGVIAIFIDGLDHLAPSDDCFRLDWLPTKIANNVKIIVSTADNSEVSCPENVPVDNETMLDHNLNEVVYSNTRSNGCELVKCLRRKVTDDEQYLELKGLSNVECIDLLDNILRDNKRSLSLIQWKIIRDCFPHNTSPLFIKLVSYETMTQWNSLHDIEDVRLESTLTFMVELLCERLEKRHGHLLVSHTLGLITASHDVGLSEMEILDILSLDDTVLNDIFVDWEPAIRRLPAFLWSRLYHDIHYYLCEVERDKITILRWSHDQIGRVIGKRYLKEQFNYR